MLIRSVLVALSFSSLPALAPQEASPRQTPPLRADWIAGDLARVDQVLRALDVRELDVSALKAALAGVDVGEDRPIGFGARRLVLSVYGGYTTAWIHVLAEAPERENGASRVAELRCDQLASVDLPAAARAKLAQRWGARATPLEKGFRVERRDDALAQELRARVERALGACAVPEAPEDLRAAFARLVSPFEDHVLGRMQGEDGAPPAVRADVDALIAAGRFDLFSAALRGMNPEGRGWAAWALLHRAKQETPLAESDRAAIEALRAVPVQYETCYGCECFREEWDAALAAIDE